MDEEAQTLIAQRAIEPLIIVGISSSGLARVNEFHAADRPEAQDGEAWLICTVGCWSKRLSLSLMVAIERSPHQPGTALGGTSLGGLATLYLGLKYKDVFGKLAIISPAAFWDDEMISRYVRSLPARTNQLIYLTVGTSDQLEFLNSTRNLREAIISKGWKEGVRL